MLGGGVPHTTIETFVKCLTSVASLLCLIFYVSRAQLHNTFCWTLSRAYITQRNTPLLLSSRGKYWNNLQVLLLSLAVVADSTTSKNIFWPTNPNLSIVADKGGDLAIVVILPLRSPWNFLFLAEGGTLNRQIADNLGLATSLRHPHVSEFGGGPGMWATPLGGTFLDSRRWGNSRVLIATRRWRIVELRSVQLNSLWHQWRF